MLVIKMSQSAADQPTIRALTRLGMAGDGATGNQQAVTTASIWGGDIVCLYVPGTTNAYAGSFTVQNQPTAAFNGNVLVFPDTNIGCEGGYCSWQSGLPALVSSGPDPIVSWNYNTWNAAPDSMWDALIDNEFSASCSGANPAFNANIAIYLDTSNTLTKLGLASANPVDRRSALVHAARAGLPGRHLRLQDRVRRGLPEDLGSLRPGRGRLLYLGPEPRRQLGLRQ